MIVVLTKSQKQRTTVNKLKELIVPIASAARQAFDAAASKEFDDVVCIAVGGDVNALLS
jgi:hypothetical protein